MLSKVALQMLLKWGVGSGEREAGNGERGMESGKRARKTENKKWEQNQLEL